MSATGAPARGRAHGPEAAAGGLVRWWPLALLMLAAAALRLSTLDLQSLWYDEAFTPVHVLHASLSATLRAMVHSENSPPLWYVLEWADTRVLGDGEVALRLPSALAGIATVPVAWAIGQELSGRRAAILSAAIVAVSPLFVWYSQEARVYGLFVLVAAVAMLCFLRAERTDPGDPASRRRLAAFALSGAVAMLTHYFAVFLLIPMVALLVRDPRRRRAAAPAAGVLVLVGLALLPLISAQGGHGTQWIGRWPISERLQAIPQYYLTGYSGAPLGHGIELLVALLIAAGMALGLWRMSEPPPRAGAGTAADGGARRAAGAAAPETEDGAAAQLAHERHGALLAFTVAAGGVLTPVVLALLGADYLAPRNLVAAMIPLTGLVAVLVATPRNGHAGAAIGAAIVLAMATISIDVNLSPRLQRGNWRGVAHALGPAAAGRAITTVELGGAPLEYYLPELRNLHTGSSVRVSEIDETGYAPLRASAGTPPAPGFRLLERLDVDGLIVYRFRSAPGRAVSEAELRRHVITLARPEVLVPR